MIVTRNADPDLQLVERFDHHDPAMADEATRSSVHASLRKGCPVEHVDAYGGFWVVSRYDDVAEAARNHEALRNGYGVTIPGALPDPDIPANVAPPLMDPPGLMDMRKMLMPWFTPQAARDREDDIVRLADNLLDGFAGKTQCDLAHDYAEPLPALFMLRLIGLPDDMWESLSEVVHLALHGPAGGSSDGTPNAVDFTSFATALAPVLEIAEQRRSDPKDDLLTYLVHADIDGEPLNPLQLLALSAATIAGGVDTTSNAIASSLVYLGRHPEIRRRLIDEPSLIPTAVEEFLRMWSPFQNLARYVAQDCEIGGQQIKEGERVLLLFQSANRDEAAFDDPESVQIDRAPNRHLAFGTGVHRCIGSNYARAELRIAIDRFLRRVPDFRVIEEGLQTQPDVSLAFGYKSVPAILGHDGLPIEMTPTPASSVRRPVASVAADGWHSESDVL
jgi:cytochrome P450